MDKSEYEKGFWDGVEREKEMADDRQKETEKKHRLIIEKRDEKYDRCHRLYMDSLKANSRLQELITRWEDCLKRMQKDSPKETDR